MNMSHMTDQRCIGSRLDASIHILAANMSESGHKLKGILEGRHFLAAVGIRYSAQGAQNVHPSENDAFCMLL